LLVAERNVPPTYPVEEFWCPSVVIVIPHITRSELVRQTLDTRRSTSTHPHTKFADSKYYAADRQISSGESIRLLCLAAVIAPKHASPARRRSE